MKRIESLRFPIRASLLTKLGDDLGRNRPRPFSAGEILLPYNKVRIRRGAMKRTVQGTLVALSAIGLFAIATASAQERSNHVLHDAATGELKPEKITVQSAPNAAPITKTMPFFSGGTLKAAEAALGLGIDRDEEASSDEGSQLDASSLDGGQVPKTIGCSERASSDNVRVNQDCTYRRQAEEKIVYNPANPN